jgi:hypothetical protein
MDHNFFNQLIKDLNIALGIHQDAIEDIDWTCTCNKNSQSKEKCPHCLIKENIHNLSESIKTLNNYSINTSNLVQFIDAEAFRYALANHTDLKEVKCYPVFNNLIKEVNSDAKPDHYIIEATYERMAMNGIGYHVGYENVTFNWKAFKKSHLEITGLPKMLSNWVVKIDAYAITSMDLPLNEEPEHDDDCEFKNSDSFDDCDCADNWEGYYRPDEDFFYQEMNHIIEMMGIPEATFDSDNREWQLGDCSFNLNEYESIPEYRESCDQENGAPHTG